MLNVLPVKFQSKLVLILFFKLSLRVGKENAYMFQYQRYSRLFWSWLCQAGLFAL